MRYLFLYGMIIVIIPWLVVLIVSWVGVGNRGGGMNELTFLDKNGTLVLKGIAILFILFSHLGGHYTRIFTPCGGIGVALFLFISGYGLTKSDEKNGLQHYWTKRLVGVWLPYVLIQVFTSGLHLLDILLIKPSHPFGWYLNYLMIWYFMFWIIHRWGFLKRNRTFFLTLTGIILFFISREIRAEQSFSFIAGVMFAVHDWKGKIQWKNGMVLLLIAIGFLACKQTAIIRESPQVIYSFIQLMIKLPAALAIICFVFCTNRWINYRYFLWVGILSYEIYLIHGYTMNIYNTGMQMIHIVLVFSGLTFALSVGMHCVDTYLSGKLWKILLYKTKDRRD